MTEESRVERTSITITFREKAAFQDTYGGPTGVVTLQCMGIRPPRDSDTVLITMHPSAGTANLPVMRQFAEAGVHVLAADSRYRGAAMP